MRFEIKILFLLAEDFCINHQCNLEECLSQLVPFEERLLLQNTGKRGDGFLHRIFILGTFSLKLSSFFYFSVVFYWVFFVN